MRVVLTTYDSRGGVEPLAALAVRLQESGAEALICAPPDCEARLVGHGWADLAATDDRDDWFVVGEVNQQALFGRVAAVVHHGGAGTTTTAARAGAPQVVVPQIGDQPEISSRATEVAGTIRTDGAAEAARMLLSSP